MYVQRIESIKKMITIMILSMILSIGGVIMRLATTKKSDLTEIMQTLCENYIRNSFLLASAKNDNKKSIETLNNRKKGYLSYVMKTAHRIAIFTSSYDYAMSTMKQRALMVAHDNNFLIPKN